MPKTIEAGERSIAEAYPAAPRGPCFWIRAPLQETTMRVLLAYSGGLDTSYLLCRLCREGHEVVAVSVDTGGFDAAESQ